MMELNRLSVTEYQRVEKIDVIIVLEDFEECFQLLDVVEARGIENKEIQSVEMMRDTLIAVPFKQPEVNKKEIKR